MGLKVDMDIKFGGSLPVAHQARPLFNIAAVMTVAGAIRTIEDDTQVPLTEFLSDRSCVVSFVNAHAINLACRDRNFLDALMRANFRLRDGSGVKMLLIALGRRSGLNMNGTDLIPRILDACKATPIALYGSSAAVAAAAAETLKRQGAIGVTHCDGFQTREHYLQRIRAERPRVVVLGMGMPRQELIADAIVIEASYPILIINGGAILDFMAGRVKRAPLRLRQIGLEWLFRLYIEPRRLWRRYLVGNAVFLTRAGVACLRYRFIGVRDSVKI